MTREPTLSVDKKHWVFANRSLLVLVLCLQIMAAIGDIIQESAEWKL